MTYFFNRVLKPTKQRVFNKAVFGYDIETYDKNRKFLCSSIYGDSLEKIFYEKHDIFEFIKDKLYNSRQNILIAATNLRFDFFGTTYNDGYSSKFDFLWRGADLIYAKTYVNKDGFHKEKPEHGRVLTVTFIDTMNYAALSVEKQGKLLNIPKLEKPDFLGQEPKNKKQWAQMIRYNLRDSEISKKFIEFLYNAFYDLGASPKNTIASTSMSLFKNKYLNNEFVRHNIPQLLEQFKAYYGGRTEAFKRGYVKKLNYYDFNSLYPSVMQNEFPDPNTLRTCHYNNISKIEAFEGVSLVVVHCPYMDIPLLPVRTPEKLLFPVGTFEGWYSHVELREALKIGYVIKKVKKTYYFTETIRPFYDFVNDMYSRRKELKEQGSSMEYVVKILMNSLYGKFGQKFDTIAQWKPIPETIEELNKINFSDRVGNYIRVKESRDPAAFCIPIWALYVTAYGRLKIHDILLKSDPYYCDTDSVLTRKYFEDSSQIGKLKLERTIKEGIIVKPKFYAFKSSDGEYVKIKGLGKRINYERFNGLMHDPKIYYDKFTTFKEALRRGLLPNEIKETHKEFSLEDTKRVWSDKFSIDEMQTSKPININELPIFTTRAEKLLSV